MRIVKTLSSIFSSEKLLQTKVLRNGKDDVLECPTATIPGIEYQPIKDDVGLHSETGVSGDDIIVGFIIKQGATSPNPGELVFRSRDTTDGTEKIYIWLKNDGVIEFGGNAGNLTRYQELETAFNEDHEKLNDLISKWNAFASAYVPGSPSVPGLPPTLAGQTVSPSTADISGAKIDELKTL